MSLREALAAKQSQKGVLDDRQVENLSLRSG
jgi:hypothetical protein